MKLTEAIRERRSVRAFLPEPVPQETITRIVDLARWAPSWGNTQPWEVVVAEGVKVTELAGAFEAEATQGATPRPDIAMPVEFPEPYKNRYVALGRDLLTFL